MKLVAFRLESALKEIVNKFIEGLNTSDKFRRAIESGIWTKERGGFYISGPFGISLDVDQISLGGGESRVDFYLEEETLGKAKALFQDEEQAVLRRALRIGVWSTYLDTGKRIEQPIKPSKTARDDIYEVPIDKLRTLIPNYIPLDVKAPDYSASHLFADGSVLHAHARVKEIKADKLKEEAESTLSAQKSKRRSTKK